MLLLSLSIYLNERTGFDSNFTVIDTFCKSCYDMHLVILRHIEKQSNVPHLQLQSEMNM